MYCPFLRACDPCALVPVLWYPLCALLSLLRSALSTLSFTPLCTLHSALHSAPSTPLWILRSIYPACYLFWSAARFLRYIYASSMMCLCILCTVSVHSLCCAYVFAVLYLCFSVQCLCIFYDVSAYPLCCVCMYSVPHLCIFCAVSVPHLYRVCVSSVPHLYHVCLSLCFLFCCSILTPDAAPNLTLVLTVMFAGRSALFCLAELL